MSEPLIFQLELTSIADNPIAMLDTIVYASQLCQYYGGSRILVQEVLAVDQYENMAKEDLLGLPTYSRQEIYDIVKNYVRPEFVPKVNIELNNRFSQSIWGDNFPLEGVVDVLINKNGSCLKSILPVVAEQLSQLRVDTSN